eukprot:jgi/Hompol1/630/HPOL_001264-RA
MFSQPFAQVMIETVTHITGRFPATFAAGVIGLVTGLVFSVIWIAGLIGLTNATQRNALSSGASYVLMVYSLFIFYWTTQVIQNSVHLTVAGLFGTYYFLGVSDGQGNVTVPVKNPTAASAKRAMTTSFGSNCYGSLIIAVIQTLRAMAKMAQDENRDNIGLAILLCILQCILACISDIMEYFNKYAFTQVAIYGKDYCTAARDTWELCKSRGIDAIINDDLVGNVLSLGSFCVGLITCLVGFLYVYISPNIPHTVGNYVVVCIVAFVIGIAEFSIMAGVIDSGIATTFVCLAEDPAALARTKPELYQKIAQVYPQALIRF